MTKSEAIAYSRSFLESDWSKVLSIMMPMAALIIALWINTNNKFDKFQELYYIESKSFHGNMERLEAEFKGQLAKQDAEFKAHMQYYHHE